MVKNLIGYEQNLLYSFNLIMRNACCYKQVKNKIKRKKPRKKFFSISTWYLLLPAYKNFNVETTGLEPVQFICKTNILPIRWRPLINLNFLHKILYCSVYILFFYLWGDSNPQKMEPKPIASTKFRHKGFKASNV